MYVCVKEKLNTSHAYSGILESINHSKFILQSSVHKNHFIFLHLKCMHLVAYHYRLKFSVAIVLQEINSVVLIELPLNTPDYVVATIKHV